MQEQIAWTQQQLERNRFVRFRTAYTFDHLVDLPRDSALKILDFGCGEGHSIDALLERYPNARFVGSDIDRGLLSTCIAHFGANPRVTLHQMENPTSTADLGSDFDVIQLNAVFEHLLPEERKKLMPDLWRRLRLHGYLVVTETPWRWFPIETHTTGLPLVNYLPDRLALAAARYRHKKPLTWTDALKYGVRGATVNEIISCIGAGTGALERVQPAKADVRDMLEVWWQGESRKTPAKALAYHALRALQQTTGLMISPWVNFVLRKTA